MIQTNYIYPKFEKGQILSSYLLNTSFGFLEEQNRITRANLIGVGILDGLNYTLSNGNLILSPGSAITNDGFIIQIPSQTTYKCCASNGNFKIKEFSPLDTNRQPTSFSYIRKKICYAFYKDEEDAKENDVLETCSIPTSLDDFLVALIIDFPETMKINCNQETCNANYIQTNIVIRPVLVLKKDVPNPYRTITSIQSKCYLNKLTGFDTMLNLKVIQRKTKELFKNNSLILAQSLNWIIDKFYNSNTSEFYDWKTIIPEWKDRINKLLNCQTKIKHDCDDSNIKNATELPQYFLLYLEDLCCAINEFIDCYNTFVSNYPLIRTSKNLFDRTIIINHINNNKKEENEYLYRFESAFTNTTFINECKILDRKLCRIYKLSNSFIAHNYNIKSSISFKWAKDNSPMGDNPIPFYYNENSIKDYWNADKLYTNILNENSIKLDSDTLLFQNCYGKNVWEVKKELKNFLSEHNISNTKIKTISVGKRRLEKKYYDCIIKIFETKKSEITNRFMNSKDEDDPCRKIAKLLGFWEYSYKSRKDRRRISRKKNDAEKINNLILKTAKLAQDSKELSAIDIEYLANKLKGLSTDKMILFHDKIMDIIRNNPTSIDKDKLYSFDDFASFFALMSYINLGYRSDIKNCIYDGGVKLNSTIYLLYFKSGVKGNPNQHKNRFLFGIYKKN